MFKQLRTITGGPSIFLDAIRFLAAITVFIVHARAFVYPDLAKNSLPNNISHGAVVIFFVLSGYVIAHTTQHNKRNFKEYCAARLTRLYSVYLPAILVSVLCYFAIKYTDADMFAKFQQESIVKALVRFATSILFLNEIWFQSTAPIINGPIWSLNYEFWFYLLFGSWFYKKKGGKPLILPLVVCLIAGPKILLMMSMWLIGWVAYSLPKPGLSDIMRWLLLASSIVVALALIVWLPDLPNSINTTRLHWADKFVSDFIVSCFIGLAFYLLPNGKMHNSANRTVLFFRKLGDLTFPIYVLHFPLLALLQSKLAPITNPTYKLLFSLLGVFFLCAVIGMLLESFRKRWLNFFSSVLR